MSLFLKRLTLCVGSIGCAFAMCGAQAAGADARQAGLAVFAEADRRSSGFADFTVDLRMILRTPSGQTSERELHIKQLEVPDDGDKVLIVFNSPASIRGTALLSHAHKVGVDDQWLFLPALKRVKKIAARNRSGPFVGSEFSFEDLSVQELTKYEYEYLREEMLDGVACFVVARVPLDEYSGYTREVFWLDRAEYRTQKVEYYDRRTDPLKVLQVSDYEQYGSIWKPHNMVMTNLRSHKSTELQWREYRFDAGLTANRDFSVASLRRVR